MKSDIDANINNQIFRNDFSQVIAMRRELASISPIRLKQIAGDYPAGQVLSYNSVSGQYEKFSTASGTYGAKCILFKAVREQEQSATGGALARGIFGGYVYKTALTDYDTNAETGLKASSFKIASGDEIVKF